jgi:hypothetical protein
MRFRDICLYAKKVWDAMELPMGVERWNVVALARWTEVHRYRAYGLVSSGHLKVAPTARFTRHVLTHVV